MGVGDIFKAADYASAQSDRWLLVLVLLAAGFVFWWLLKLVEKHIVTLKDTISDNRAVIAEFRSSMETQAAGYQNAMREASGQITIQADVIQKTAVSVDNLARCVSGLAMELERHGVFVPQIPDPSDPHSPPRPRRAH